jgi:hypothetical protein
MRPGSLLSATVACRPLPSGVRPIALAGFVLAGVATPRSAAASVMLDWAAPDVCPSSAAVSDAIDRSVGESQSAARVHARVVVTQEGRAFQADIDLGDSGSGQTRHIEADSCSELADAVALVVALAADSDVPASPRETPRHDAPPERPAPAQDTRPRALPAPGPSRDDWSASASFALDTAILPTPAPGADIALGYGPSRATVEIDGTFLAPQSATLADRPSQGARMWLAQAGARACYAVVVAQVDVGPCAGGGVASIFANGFGGSPDLPKNAMAIISVGALGARARLLVGRRLVLRLTAEAVIPSSRPTFEIDGGGDVFHVPAASFRAALGAEVRF